MTILLHPRVLELMASRICHDLVSPVGAVSNGIELMQELGPDAGEEAAQLVASSAQQASIRLKCFRLAYGAAGTDKNIGLREVRDSFSDLMKGARVKLEFAPGLDTHLASAPRGFFKCLLNLMILAEECTRGEGAIAVFAVDGAAGARVTVTGAHIAFREGVEAALKVDGIDPENLEPRSVHAYITGCFAVYFGLKIETQGAPDFGRVELTLSY